MEQGKTNLYTEEMSQPAIQPPAHNELADSQPAQVLDAETQFLQDIEDSFKKLPFKDETTRGFFEKWGQAVLAPKINLISRQEWLEKYNGQLIDREKLEKPEIFLPDDVRLPELARLVVDLDATTFPDSEINRIAAPIRLYDYGMTMQKIGLYLRQRLDTVRHGQAIIESLANHYFAAGQATVAEIQKQSPDLLASSPIRVEVITAEETAQIDRLLVGDDMYRSRQEKAQRYAEKNNISEAAAQEIIRRQTVEQYLQVLMRALKYEVENRLDNNEVNYASLRANFAQKARDQIKDQAEKPESELTMAMYRSGVEKVKETLEVRGWKRVMLDYYGTKGIDIPLERKRIVDLLPLDKMKSDLESARLTEDKEAISKKELEIADAVIKVINSLPYTTEATNFSQVTELNKLQCLTGTLLIRSILKDLGIRTLSASPPMHAVALVITENDKIYWREPQSADLNFEITTTDIQNEDSTGVFEKLIAIAHEDRASGAIVADINILDIKGIAYLFGMKSKERVIISSSEHILALRVLGHMSRDKSMPGFESFAARKIQSLLSSEELTAVSCQLLGLSQDPSDKIEFFKKIPPSLRNSGDYLGVVWAYMKQNRTDMAERYAKEGLDAPEPSTGALATHIALNFALFLSKLKGILDTAEARSKQKNKI